MKNGRRLHVRSRRSAQNGFTLIELLVALSIFAMLAAAGVMLLANAVSAQGQVAVHLDRQGGMLRVVSLIDQDMAEAVPRISRTESGLLAPAFFSRAPSEDEPFLEFVRGGWTNLDNAARPDLQKLQYWLRGGRLERVTYGQIDGGQATQPATLIEGVQAITLGFRDDKGEWRDVWQNQDPRAMPSAVRMTIQRQGYPPLTLMFRVGAPVPRKSENLTEAPGA